MSYSTTRTPNNATMSEELIPAPHNAALRPVMECAQAVANREAVIQFVRAILKRGEDYGKIPGTGKATLLKPGAEKLCNFFGLFPDFVTEKEIEDWEAGFFCYRVKCILRREGDPVASGIASCNSKERKYRNAPGFDLVNTILKMAQKRALIAATLIACNASEMFTQDIEDIEVARRASARPAPADHVDHDTGEIVAPRNPAPAPSNPQKRFYTLWKDRALPSEPAYMRAVMQRILHKGGLLTGELKSRTQLKDADYTYICDNLDNYLAMLQRKGVTPGTEFGKPSQSDIPRAQAAETGGDAGQSPPADPDEDPFPAESAALVSAGGESDA